jgi:ribosomal protein S18 acetylase RimI-like enzyme
MSDVPEVSLRPVVADDSEMLYRVLFETMRDYVVATWGAWDEKRVRDECTERARSPEARVILFEDQPAGLFSVERQGDHIHLDQLYVLPRFQRLGIGTKLIRDLLEEGRVCGRPVTL